MNLRNCSGKKHTYCYVFSQLKWVSYNSLTHECLLCEMFYSFHSHCKVRYSRVPYWGAFVSISKPLKASLEAGRSVVELIWHLDFLRAIKSLYSSTLEILLTTFDSLSFLRNLGTAEQQSSWQISGF